MGCIFFVALTWSGKRDSNSRRLPWQGNALPLSHSRIGGNNRARTYDPLLVRQMLSQLSYASKPELLVYNTKLKKKLQLFFGGFSKKIKIFFHSRKAAFSRPKNPSEYYARHSRRLGILRHIERKRNIPRLK